MVGEMSRVRHRGRVAKVSTAGATIGPDLASETISSYILGRDFRDNRGFSVVAFSFGRFGP